MCAFRVLTDSNVHCATDDLPTEELWWTRLNSVSQPASQPATPDPFENYFVSLQTEFRAYLETEPALKPPKCLLKIGYNSSQT